MATKIGSLRQETTKVFLYRTGLRCRMRFRLCKIPFYYVTENWIVTLDTCLSIETVGTNNLLQICTRSTLYYVYSVHTDWKMYIRCFIRGVWGNVSLGAGRLDWQNNVFSTAFRNKRSYMCVTLSNVQLTWSYFLPVHLLCTCLCAMLTGFDIYLI